MNTENYLIPAPKLADEFGVTRRTLARWLNDAQLNFPKATRINGRLYFRRVDVDEWKAARLRASLSRAMRVA